MQDETIGTVVVWNHPEGWGVLRSPDLADDVWVHFSDVETIDGQGLNVGNRVRFRYRAARQDGWTLRATWVHRLP